MRFIHLSDLHLGKRVNGFSMIEDQQYILTRIINIIDEEKPDAVLIAGDVYDKSVPSEDAMQLWDNFLNRLSRRQLSVYGISGNHDSAVRFADHSELIAGSGIHLAPAYEGSALHFEEADAFGRIHIYLLPFIKPAAVRGFFPERELKDYTDAVDAAIRKMQINTNERNILVAHQFVTGADRCESEEITVGGLDDVSVSVFEPFDYVALGHIHGPQYVGRESVRYCGTPLKYSFSEQDHHKSVTLVDIGEKGAAEGIIIKTIPLEPMHDMRQIRGSYEELTARIHYQGTAVDDYLHAVLTDEDDIPGAMGKLRVIYPNLMKLSYDNKRTRENREVDEAEDAENKSPLELFETFYELQNNQPMSGEQKAFTEDLIRSVWEV